LDNDGIYLKFHVNWLAAYRWRYTLIFPEITQACFSNF